MLSLTLETAGWWQLCGTQIHAENLNVWLTVAGEDAGAEVVSWAQRPAARVLEQPGKHYSTVSESLLFLPAFIFLISKLSLSLHHNNGD